MFDGAAAIGGALAGRPRQSRMDERGQSGNQIQRFENDVGGSVAPAALQTI